MSEAAGVVAHAFRPGIGRKWLKDLQEFKTNLFSITSYGQLRLHTETLYQNNNQTLQGLLESPSEGLGAWQGWSSRKSWV